MSRPDATAGSRVAGARETWSSTAGFVLASVGSAVGIGNLWRFPYVVGTNGGGAFLIPYVIAIAACGLPLMILEFALGRHYRSSVVPVFAAMGRRLVGLGFLLVFIQTMILAYYLVVTGWVLAYFLAFTAGAPISFAEFTASYTPLLFFGLSGLICFAVVSFGVRGGLERLCNILMPALFLMLALLVTIALALPDAGRGVAFYLTPDFSRLAEPRVWVAALGQAFFSLGVGTGIMLTYGSYQGQGSLVKSAVIVSAADLAVALLAGLVIFPVVFSFGFDPAAGVQLAFVTLPLVFEEMGFGFLFGSVFFLLLFFAALTSAVSILELPVATLVDTRAMRRRPAAALVTTVIMLLGLPSALSYSALRIELFGMPFLDLKDLAFGTVGMMVGALVLSLTAGWALRERILPGPLMVLVRFVVPVVLAVTLVARLAERQ